MRDTLQQSTVMRGEDEAGVCLSEGHGLVERV
jgi:hypothetical protein